MIITSRENKIYKMALALRTKKGREEYGLFIIEGVRSVADAAKKGAEIAALIICDGVSFHNIKNENTYIFAPKLFSELSETVTPQGIIALCRIPKTYLSDINLSEGGCVVLCESLQDPGNLGTIIRSAHAAFCDGVVLTKGCCDLFNPKTVRATMSAIFSIPIVTGVNCIDAIKYFNSMGCGIVAGALSPRAVSLFDADISGNVVIAVGNEGNGLTAETLEKCDSIVKIPMNLGAESLNASVAASIMIYEHLRQKNQKK